ncbi:polysaccharide deacetylase family protein [Veillonella intestinalis]|uniref:polysaccharide deacetylase family protein n=1 Tax=Veillonella intestinalis TaxID=2941341 RepID=UPI00203AC424|nr:polysaccharide deacetylase family protein [Veillonella intestinalis]
MKRFIVVFALLGSLLMLLAGCMSETKDTTASAAQAQPQKVTKTVATAVPKGIPVLMYHKVGPEEDNDAVIREDLFRAQMKLLHDKGFNPITMEQLNDYVRHGKAVPVKPVVLTFDDGYEDTYSIVYPVLKEYGFAGTVFVNPGDVGTRLTWEQIKEMHDNGITIASHGYDHVRMNELSDSEQLANIVKAQMALKEKLGIDNQWFCYPYGRENEYSQKAATDNGILLAVTMNPGWVHEGDNPYALQRIWIGNAVDLAHFEERITTEEYADL